MRPKLTQYNRPGYLKIEFPNFSGARKALVQHRSVLRKLKPSSSRYKSELKAHFELLIFAKAHALSLDTKAERRRLLNLLANEMEYIKYLPLQKLGLPVPKQRT
jgi:hypothetical protein